MLDPVVRAALADSLVVWLRTSPSTLAGRVRPGDHRPLLGDSPAETFAAMAEMRSELYRQVATAIIDTDDRAPEAIADEVVGLLGRQPDGRLSSATERHDAATTGHHDARDQAARRHLELRGRRGRGRAGPRAGGGPPCRDARRMPVPSSFNDVLVDPELHDHVGDVWYQRSGLRSPRLGRAAGRAALRRGDPPRHGRGSATTCVVEHEGGYTPFEADVTAFVTPGEECRLTVVVNNELTWQSIPPGRRRGAAGRDPAAAAVPRLLQLRRPAPQRLAVHDTTSHALTTSPS